MGGASPDIEPTTTKGLMEVIHLLSDKRSGKEAKVASDSFSTLEKLYKQKGGYPFTHDSKGGQEVNLKTIE
jgi:hypothetical protein